MAKTKFGSKPGPRKFNGKKYNWVGWGTSKANAKKRAAELKAKGYKNVRVVLAPGTKTQSKNWDVYGRK